MQIVADYLMFEHMQVNLYDLPPWLAEEVRDVMRIYWQNRPKDG